MYIVHFLKPFLKGTFLQSGEWESGKFDFDHHFPFLTNFLKIQNFFLSGILYFRLVAREDHFQKKMWNVQNGPSLHTYTSWAQKYKYFIYFWQKIVVCCFLFVAGCNTLSDSGLLFLLIEALIELRKMLIRKKLFDVRFAWELLNPGLRYPDSADLVDLQRCNWLNF